MEFDESNITSAVASLESAVQIDTERINPLPDAWVTDVQLKVRDLKQQFHEETLPRHTATFQQIREEDIALQPRINAMKQADTKIIETLDQVQNTLERFSDTQPPDESEVGRLVEQVQNLIGQIRKQQAEVTKWLNESLLRDRGFPHS